MTATASVATSGEEVIALFSIADDLDLRSYFACDLPPVPGDRSSFGPMCTRVASVNRRSAERPSAGASWTEIVDCHGAHAGSPFDAEEAFVAYVDVRARFRRIRAALARVSTTEYATLEAYFAPEPLPDHPLGRLASVGPLTQAAIQKNRARAARGQHEAIGETVRWLAASTSRDARSALDDVRRQAAALLREAKASYALARILGGRR